MGTDATGREAAQQTDSRRSRRRSRRHHGGRRYGRHHRGQQSSAEALANVEARNEFGVNNDIEDLMDPSLATPFRRLTTPSYPGDGSGAEWDAPEPSTNPQTPPNSPDNTGTAVQPLKITDNIYAPGSDDNRPNSGGLNDYSVFFSQFVNHDMQHSVRSAGPPIFLDGQFIPVSRTPAVSVDGVRTPVSADTPTLDLGLVYGRDANAEILLRESSSHHGQRVAGAKLIAGGEGDVLPSYAEVAAHQGESLESVQETLGTTFLNLPPEALASQVATGDERANQTASLVVHHTIWHRNHNWHVDQLREANPHWSEDELYQGARALNEAEYQKVIYDEYLPQLMGEGAISEYTGYKPEVDNRSSVEFAAVANRFGHDQTSDGQTIVTEDGRTAFVPLEISSFIANNGQSIKTDDVLGDWTRGQLAQSSQEIDGRIVSTLRNSLFGVPASADDPSGSSTEFLQLNLPLLDIHRGRDHGVSDYNQLREGLGLETYDSLEEFAHANSLDQERLDQLKSVYSDISELDSIVGGLLEAKVPGSQLGETFQKVQIEQFEATRDGDQFFYKNRFKDSPETLKQIEQTSMATILQRNGVVDNPTINAFQATTQQRASDNPVLPGFENGLPGAPSTEPGAQGQGTSPTNQMAASDPSASPDAMPMSSPTATTAAETTAPMTTPDSMADTMVAAVGGVQTTTSQNASSQQTTVMESSASTTERTAMPPERTVAMGASAKHSVKTRANTGHTRDLRGHVTSKGRTTIDSAVSSKKTAGKRVLDKGSEAIAKSIQHKKNVTHKLQQHVADVWSHSKRKVSNPAAKVTHTLAHKMGLVIVKFKR